MILGLCEFRLAVASTFGVMNQAFCKFEVVDTALTIVFWGSILDVSRIFLAGMISSVLNRRALSCDALKTCRGDSLPDSL